LLRLVQGRKTPARGGGGGRGSELEWAEEAADDAAFEGHGCALAP